MSIPQPGRMNLEDEVIRGIVDLSDFLEDDFPLESKIRVIQARGQHKVGQNIERERDVLIQYPALVGCVLPTGIGVQRPTNCLQRVGDLQSRAALRALEHHVLEEMADARVSIGFVGGSLPDPDSDRG